ncbi:MAG: class D sortase [Pseudomonadota bacterium]
MRSVEWSSYAAGVALTGIFVVQLAQGEAERRADIASFQATAESSASSFGTQGGGAQAGGPQADGAQADTAMLSITADDAEPAAQGSDALPFDLPDSPDTSLWAPGRIDDYRASLVADLPPVLGVLEVPAIGLEVPVYSTSTDLTMDRGAGIINGMSYPHEPGNIGISGHRDGYFRVLKDVEIGDKLVLDTLEGDKLFTVDSTQVVEITDTRLLQDTDDQTVTLVTCYPFYFVGHAPQRFIVTASLDTTNVNQR